VNIRIDPINKKIIFLGFLIIERLVFLIEKSISEMEFY